LKNKKIRNTKAPKKKKMSEHDCEPTRDTAEPPKKKKFKKKGAKPGEGPDGESTNFSGSTALKTDANSMFDETSNLESNNDGDGGNKEWGDGKFVRGQTDDGDHSSVQSEDSKGEHVFYDNLTLTMGQV
jgi:hypothetical protein